MHFNSTGAAAFVRLTRSNSSSHTAGSRGRADDSWGDQMGSDVDNIGEDSRATCMRDCLISSNTAIHEGSRERTEDAMQEPGPGIDRSPQMDPT